jgi:glycosyltransferase involved in cell wall biosynthesis
MNKKVSIITPCYNGARYISETIDSVISQSYKDWEMLIVNDGSTDNSEEIICKYSEKEPRIKYIKQNNSGSAVARNRGIKECTGRYIALLDADDLWDSQFLEKQINFMSEKNSTCVFCSYRRIDENSKEIMRPTVAKKIVTIKDMRVMNQIGCLTGLYDTAVHGKIYLHEELKSLRDDYAYWYDVVSTAGIVYGNEQVLASYRVMSNSTTGNKFKLIKIQYKFYRMYLSENVFVALLNTIKWGISGLRKFSN